MTPPPPEDSAYLWTEAGDEKIGPVAEVAPILNIDRTYTFSVPPELTDSIRVGLRVMVPLRRKGTLTPGFVVRLDQRRWDSTLRPIDSAIDQQAFLTPELVELGRQISQHYCCPLGTTLKAMTPQAVRERRGLKHHRYAVLNAPAIETQPRITAKQTAVINRLSGRSEPMELSALLQESGASAAVIRTMIKKGLLDITTKEVPRELLPPTTLATDPTFVLNSDQQEALSQTRSAVDARTFGVLVLFGVSGSGKTEVYIRAIQQVVATGKQAIFLVPEIVLTTQLAARLSARFPGVAIQHSGLTESQRATIWREIAAGRRNVIVGTRSAVFAPCPSLGLIVVDEEQEGSYKNLQAPRFHVRDVAIMRAKQVGIPIVLGSATPSLETWHRSTTRRDYRLLQMPRRVKELPMPAVHIVDMRDEILEQKKPVLLSRTMERLLSESLERGEQALILMNRRGFSHRVFCGQCKTRLSCPNCSAGLVVHSTSGQSVCHYCRTRITTPTKCPQLGCGGTLIHVGIGTQKVEELIAHRFPAARIQRVDSDTMHKREHYENLIADFEARKVDVLVGTQMIAKGLDFPLVSFVGMMHTEGDGLSADFRAHERLFQLVTQVAGRAGRESVPGSVVIQTLTPELPALQFAIHHDYAGFAAAELSVRSKVRFPPFARLARFIVSHPREEVAGTESALLAERIRTTINRLTMPRADVLGPGHAPMPRLRGRYRYDLLLRTESASDLRRMLQTLRADRSLSVRTASLTVDVDPVSLA